MGTESQEQACSPCTGGSASLGTFISLPWGGWRVNEGQPPSSLPTPSSDVSTVNFKLRPTSVSGLATGRSAWCRLHPPQPVAPPGAAPAALPSSAPELAGKAGSEAPGVRNGNLHANKVFLGTAWLGGAAAEAAAGERLAWWRAPRPLWGLKASSHQEVTPKLGLKTRPLYGESPAYPQPPPTLHPATLLRL